MLWRILLFEVFLATALHILYHPLEINHDAAGLLQTGILLFEGKTPYLDFTSTNPPLIMFLNTIPAAVATISSAHIIVVFKLIVLFLGMGSACVILRLLKRSGLDIEEKDRWPFAVAYSLLSLILLHRPFNYDFGQREHLFVLLYLPFLVGRWIRWEGGSIDRPDAMVIGLAGGLGAFIKPHFLAIAVLVECYGVLSTRSLKKLFSGETYAFATAGILYAAHFFLLSEAARQELFERWLPFVADRYDVYDNSYAILLDRPSFLLTVLASLPLAYVVARCGNGWMNLAKPLAVFTFGAVLSFILQHKLWPYHLIPALFGAALIWAISVGRCFDRLYEPTERGLLFALWLLCQAVVVQTATIAYFHKRLGMMPAWGWLLLLLAVAGFVFLRTRLGASVVVGAVLAILVGWAPWHHSDPLKRNPVAQAISEHTNEDEAVMFIATSTSAAFPVLVQMNRRPGSRYFITWPIPLFYKGVTANADGTFPYHIGSELPDGEARFLRELAEDLATIRPRMILVRQGRHNQACPEGFDLRDYLTESGLMERILAEYRPRTDAHGYDVWVRENRE
jgi:hypothetical protein